MLKYFPPLKNINLPNIVTTISVVIGFTCFSLTVNSHFVLAVDILPLTIICDRLDGFLARKLNSYSDFGKKIDSFVDLFNFCFLPAFISYCSGFDSFPEYIILAVYFLSGLWRLSNFNVSDSATKNGKPCFVGLATPYGAGIFVILFALKTWGMLNLINVNWCFGIFFLTTAVLQVSSVKIEKSGLLTKLLFLLTPIAVILLLYSAWSLPPC